MDNRHLLELRIDQIQRQLMCYTLAHVLPLYIVTEYPKSGGTWVSQMLSAYMRVPFPRNQRPRIESCIMHGHYLYSPRLRNTICVMRDGRDVMVSAYYHFLFQTEQNSTYGVKKFRKAMPFKDYENIRQHLPYFIEYMSTQYARQMHFTWSEFVLSWHSSGLLCIHYEDLLIEPLATLSQIIRSIAQIEPDEERIESVVSTYSFEARSGRQPGIERLGSSMRKGISGDWRNKFTREAGEVFDHFCGDALINLGYEEDQTWVRRLEG